MPLITSKLLVSHRTKELGQLVVAAHQPCGLGYFSKPVVEGGRMREGQRDQQKGRLAVPQANDQRTDEIEPVAGRHSRIRARVRSTVGTDTVIEKQAKQHHE